MPRGIFVPLVAFVLPFAIYWIYRLIQQRRAQTRRSPWPVTVIFLSGAMLAIETFALTALTEPHSSARAPGSTHVIEDGR
jgi:hypothetical protein